MKEVLKSLLLMTSLMTLSTFSSALQQPFDSQIIAQNTSKTTLFKTDVSFLPVEQAFDVSASIDQDKLVFDWFIEDRYYLYKDRFKLIAIPSEVTLGKFEYETGITKWDDFFEAELEVYYQHTRLKVPFDSDQQPFQLRLESQGCADAGLCYPPHSHWFEINPTTGLITSIAAPSNQTPTISENDISTTPLWLILLFAMGGGLILNLMPCVFPVLSIKVLSFTRNHQTTYEKQLHGLAYTLGIIASFLVIAALMLSLRTAGEAIGWGFQLQSPGFVIFLIYLFTIMVIE